MQLAFVNSTKRWGGVKTWMITFAKGLCEKGHSCYTYARQSIFINTAIASLGHGKRVTFGPDMNPFLIFWFLKEFQKRKIEVVVVNVGKDLSTAGIAARLLRIPVVQRIGLPNDVVYSWKTRILHWFIQPIFLSPCQYIADGFLKALPYLSQKDIVVILNGKKWLEEPFNMHKPLRFICTQQLEPDKGHIVLLEAFSKIKEPFEFHIWGTGSMEQQLKRYSQKLGLQSKVFFRGFSININKELLESDVFLLASFREGLPNTLLEAMAVGLLPITRLVGGVDEIFIPELSKWALPYEAGPQEFQECIEEVFKLSEQDFLLYRKHAREACKKNFDIEKQVVVFENWLCGLVDDKCRKSNK